jgi:uncharacterized protein YkwD
MSAMRRTFLRLRIALALPLVSSLVACGARHGEGAASPGESEERPSKSEVVTTTRETPTGTVTETTTTTTRWVEPPEPAERAADPLPGDALVRYNLERLNVYRKQAGVGALKYDAAISAFALEGSQQLSKDHQAHAHFRAKAQGAAALGTRSAENQGDWNGVPKLADDPIENGKKQIDWMLDLMFKEGPGGGHHDNMLNAKFKRVGIGLTTVAGKLYLTNDFSN